jgi:hypothetical protein
MNPVLPELLVSKVQFARLGGLTLFQTVSANRLDFDVEQSSKFFEFAGDVADADGAVVGWAVGIPLLHEGADPDRKFVTAVGVANLQDRARHGLALGFEAFLEASELGPIGFESDAEESEAKRACGVTHEIGAVKFATQLNARQPARL